MYSRLPMRAKTLARIETRILQTCFFISRRCLADMWGLDGRFDCAALSSSSFSSVSTVASAGRSRPYLHSIVFPELGVAGNHMPTYSAVAAAIFTVTPGTNAGQQERLENW